MMKILHQQRLLLEVLSMSGNIAVPDKDNGTILFQTLIEAKDAGWITLSPFGTGFDMATITDVGRAAIKDCRKAKPEKLEVERRRALYS